ncbi:MAG: hypothetical protein H0V82_02730 [Candidatus Protochlamydia sp.]|nr:hypothetical protein [Candidatus Protochlamydia sp.]
MEPSHTVSLKFKNNLLELFYDNNQNEIYFNKCVIDHKINFFIHNIWINEQPAEFLKTFTTQVLEQSNLSHFALIDKDIKIYLKKADEVSVEIDDLSSSIFFTVSLDLKINGLAKMLNFTADASFYNEEGSLLKNECTFFENGIKANGRLIIHKNKTFTSGTKNNLNAFTDGLNIPGECNKKECELFNRKQTVSKGFGVFKINEISKKTLCRICETPLSTEPDNYFFFACDFSANGVMPNGKMIDFPLQTAKFTHAFKEYNYQKIAKWKELTFMVQKTPIKPTPGVSISNLIGAVAMSAIVGLSIGYILVQIKKSNWNG